MVARTNKLQEKYGLNAESCTEDWNKELETAVRRHRRQQNIRHSLAKKTCEDFLNVSSFHGQAKARDYVQFNRLDEIAAIHSWRAGHSNQEAHASSDTSNQTPTAPGASKKRQSSTFSNIAQKFRTNQGNHLSTN